MQPELLRESLGGICVELGLELPPATADRLLAYLSLLHRWNATYNLTAVRDPVVGPLRRQLAAGSQRRLLDVGSGGGLPGVVLAALEPGWSVTCVDSVGKKVAFIRQVAAELSLRNLTGEHSRIEALQAPPFDLITSRAFASLADFVVPTRRLLAPTGVWAAMKGKSPELELAALPPGITVFHVEPLTVPGLQAERCLVWMREAAPPSPGLVHS